MSVPSYKHLVVMEADFTLASIAVKRFLMVFVKFQPTILAGLILSGKSRSLILHITIGSSPAHHQSAWKTCYNAVAEPGGSIDITYLISEAYSFACKDEMASITM